MSQMKISSLQGPGMEQGQFEISLEVEAVWVGQSILSPHLINQLPLNLVGAS